MAVTGDAARPRYVLTPDAYSEGFEAGLGGIEFNSNPYPTNGDCHDFNEWDEGHCDATNWVRKLLSAFGSPPDGVLRGLRQLREEGALAIGDILDGVDGRVYKEPSWVEAVKLN